MECFEEQETPDVYRGLMASLVAPVSRHHYEIYNGGQCKLTYCPQPFQPPSVLFSVWSSNAAQVS